jgi:hypothetical protein
MRSSQNGLVHGARSKEAQDESRRLNALMREYRDILRSLARG